MNVIMTGIFMTAPLVVSGRIPIAGAFRKREGLHVRFRPRPDAGCPRRPRIYSFAGENLFRGPHLGPDQSDPAIYQMPLDLNPTGRTPPRRSSANYSRWTCWLRKAKALRTQYEPSDRPKSPIPTSNLVRSPAEFMIRRLREGRTGAEAKSPVRFINEPRLIIRSSIRARATPGP